MLTLAKSGPTEGLVLKLSSKGSSVAKFARSKEVINTNLTIRS